jgi:hypothetical protein
MASLVALPKRNAWAHIGFHSRTSERSPHSPEMVSILRCLHTQLLRQHCKAGVRDAYVTKSSFRADADIRYYLLLRFRSLSLALLGLYTS